MNPLYSAALAADEAYSATIARLYPGRDRWTLTKAESLHPEIIAAYNAKLSADNAWLMARFANAKDAAFTLRAVNAHAELVEMVKEMLAHDSAKYRDILSRETIDDEDSRWINTQEKARALLAALAR